MNSGILVLFLFFLPISCKNETKQNVIGPESAEKETVLTDEQNLKKPIKVTSPKPGEVLRSPLEVEGEAKGYWFFEAAFKIKLTDESFKTIAESYAETKEDWMTRDWVPFTGSIKFDSSNTKRGYLIFHRANPSGLEGNAMSDTVPVKFSH